MRVVFLLSYEGWESSAKRFKVKLFEEFEDVYSALSRAQELLEQQTPVHIEPITPKR